MKSAAYYVRKGIRNSLYYYLKHPHRIFLCLLFELVKLISMPIFFLTPAFEKMQFNHTKMLYETRDASYSKSFDDADKNFLNRLLFCTIFLFISITIAGAVYGVIYLVLFLIKSFLTNFASTSSLTAFNDVSSVISLFGIILSSVILIYCFINFCVGNFISCASNSLSLGDVLYNTLLTMKKNAGKIVLVFALYFLIIFSYVFLFGFPSLLVYSFLHDSQPELYQKILSVLITFFTLIFIIFYPIIITAIRLSLFEVCDICAELDQRVVVVTKKDLRGNTIKVNVLPYEEKSKRLDVHLNDLSLLKKKKEKQNDGSESNNRNK